MPNRTIYLPDELDEMSRQLGLNLSHLTQGAIREVLARQSDETVDACVASATKRISEMGLTWPDNHLQIEREDSGER